MPSFEGDARRRAGVQDGHPLLRARPEAHCCHTPLDPGAVEAVEGLLEVQEDLDTWLLRIPPRELIYNNNIIAIIKSS